MDSSRELLCSVVSNPEIQTLPDTPWDCHRTADPQTTTPGRFSAVLWQSHGVYGKGFGGFFRSADAVVPAGHVGPA